MPNTRLKKILLAGTAIVAVAAFSTPARAATDTLTANGIWGETAGVGLPAAGTGAGDSVDLATDTLTITNDHTANDGSANKDTFSLGTIDNNAIGAGAIDITQAAAGTGNPLSVTIGSVTNSGTGASTMTITNSNAANKAVNVTDSGVLTLGGGLTIDNASTTATAATNLTVTGAATVAGATAITGGTVAGSNGVLTLNGVSNTLSGAVTLTDVAGGAGGKAELIFGAANTADTLTGGIVAGATDEGTVMLNGSNAISGAGAWGTSAVLLHEVDAGANGTTSSIAAAVNATTLNITGTGSLALNDAGVNTITGTVFNGDGTLSIGAGGTLASTVTTATANTGTLTFAAAGTMTGTIGTSAKQLKLINAGAGAVSISGLANATALDFNGANTVSLNGAGANTIGTVAFGTNVGTLSLGTGANLTGAITTGTADQGTVTLAGASTISGAVGTSTDEILTLNAGVQGTASTLSGAVYSNHVAINGGVDAAATGSATFGNTLNVGATGMTVVSAGSTTAQVENATVTGDFTDAGTLGITAAAAAGANATLTLNGASNTVTGATTLTDGTSGLATLDVKGAAVTFTGGVDGGAAGTGTLTLDGTGAQTVTGTVGGVNKLLAVTASSSKTTTFNGAVSATTVNVNGTDAATFKNAVTGNILFGAGATGSATVDGAFAGSLNGTGGAVGSGVGTVTLGATSAGVTTIGDTGILKALTISNPTAGTAITVTGTNVNAADTTNLGINTLATSGTFSLGAAQSLNLSSYSGTAYGNVAVTGAASLSATGNINFTNNVSGNATYTLVTAGSGITAPVLKVDGATVTTTPSTVGLMQYTEAVSGTALTVTATRQAISSSLGSALTTNDLGVGAALDTINTGGTATGSLATAENLLASAGSASALHSSLQSLQPTVDGGAEQAALVVGDETQGVLYNRLAALRTGDTSSGVAAGYSSQGVNSWFEGYGQHAHEDARSNIDGYSSNMAGGAVGVDTVNLPNGDVLGFAINYGQSWVNSKNANTTRTTVHTYGGNFYGTFKLPEHAFVNGQLGYAYNAIESDRHNADLAGATAVGKTHSDQYTARAALGRNYAMESGMTLTPLASVNYTYLKTDGYTESGAGGSDLSVQGNDQNVLDLGLGVNAGWKIRADDQGDVVRPGVHAGYTYSALDDRIQTTSSFTGDTANTLFTTTGASPARSTFYLGTNVVYATTANWDFSANYDFQYKSGYTSHTGVLRATIHF